jgi:hypothetical protein
MAEGESDKVRVLTRRFVQFTVEVSEEIYDKILLQSKDPNRFVGFLLEREFGDAESGVDSLRFANDNQEARLQNNEWTKEKMLVFIGHLVRLWDGKRPDVDVLLGLLASYAEEESPRPTTLDLRRNRGLEHISDEAWHQELRTSKSRLTITAKHLGLPHKELFTSPYGRGVKRIHPINPECFSALFQWREKGISFKQDKDQTGLIAHQRYESVLKTPTPHHLA